MVYFLFFIQARKAQKIQRQRCYPLWSVQVSYLRNWWRLKMKINTSPLTSEDELSYSDRYAVSRSVSHLPRAIGTVRYAYPVGRLCGHLLRLKSLHYLGFFLACNWRNRCKMIGPDWFSFRFIVILDVHNTMYTLLSIPSKVPKYIGIATSYRLCLLFLSFTRI